MRTTTGSSPQPFHFTGEQRDSESGFYYLRARYESIVLLAHVDQQAVPHLTKWAYQVVGATPRRLAAPFRPRL